MSAKLFQLTSNKISKKGLKDKGPLWIQIKSKKRKKEKRLIKKSYKIEEKRKCKPNLRKSILRMTIKNDTKNHFLSLYFPLSNAVLLGLLDSDLLDGLDQRKHGQIQMLIFLVQDRNLFSF